MQRRYNPTHFILAGVVVLVLTPLMVAVDAQTQGRIAFMSDRDWNWEIYVMDADGRNPRNITNHLEDDEEPAWYNPVLSVAPANKKVTISGPLKQVDR